LVFNLLLFLEYSSL